MEDTLEYKSFFSGLKKYEIGMLLASIIILIGSVLPWVKAYNLFESVTYSGIEIYFGVITLILALLVILLVFVFRKFDKKVISNRLSILFGSIILIITISFFEGFLEEGSSYSLFSPTYEIGIGVGVIFVGAIILLISAVIGTFRD